MVMDDGLPCSIPSKEKGEPLPRLCVCHILSTYTHIYIDEKNSEEKRREEKGWATFSFEFSYVLWINIRMDEIEKEPSSLLPRFFLASSSLLPSHPTIEIIIFLRM